MTLPLGLGTLDFGDWFKSLVAAFISGGASAVTSGLVVSLSDPKDYAIGTAKFFTLVASVFVMSGTMNMLSFLRTKPIPDTKAVTTTVTTAGRATDTNPVITTKVEETHIEPK
jgi:hypothetical protein